MTTKDAAMPKRIAVLGANGVLGRHLLPRLAGAGLQVRAVVRRPEAAAYVSACGAEAAFGDIFDVASLTAAVEGCDLCINIATSLPGPSGRGDFDANDRLRREGTPLVIEACRAAGVGRLLQQSISWVNAAGERLVDETHEAEPSGDDIASRASRAALDMEAIVKASGLDWVILRGGLFYGPGTGFDADWFARAAEGSLKLPGDGSGFVSLVHVSDMAAAVVATLGAWPSRETLIIADDRPARWRDVFGHVAVRAGGQPPQEGGKGRLPSFRVSNRKARDLLGWTPFFGDYRAGLAR